MTSISVLAALPAAPALTEAADIHVLFMAGIVFLAGIAGVGSVLLLLLAAPLLGLVLRRQPPGNASVDPGPAQPTTGARPAAAAPQKHDDGAEPRAQPRALGDEAA
ncbi:hypothetical protein AB0N65_10370 [Paenarthrobacter sp. NPDC089322]|uniref:hypothetical protein n=1 Tax=Paenarthrobacter sp. NPDC089322 TaxID=3155065 RepID=UPI003433D2BF